MEQRRSTHLVSVYSGHFHFFFNIKAWITINVLNIETDMQGFKIPDLKTSLALIAKFFT